MRDIEIVKSSLNNIFKIKDLDRLEYFFFAWKLLEIKKKYISVKKNVLDVLVDPSMLSAKHAITLRRMTMTLCFIRICLYISIYDATSYRIIIERLLYLVNTRPYIIFVVQFLFSVNLCKLH